MTEDLISFDDDDTNTNTKHPKPTKSIIRDSFSDLTRLMREKKPYAASTPSPRLPSMSERDEAVLAHPDAHANMKQHQDRAQKLTDALAKSEKTVTHLRFELMEERLKVTHLEDENEDLRRLSNKAELEDLRRKLREKTSLCDRQRNQVKIAEAQLEHALGRIQDITQNGLSLQGATHLVKPNANTKLPKLVFPCSECYANNSECDNNVVCQSCTDGWHTCARWRCSLKHKLGSCPLTPCKFHHDEQGWLVLKVERAQW